MGHPWKSKVFSGDHSSSMSTSPQMSSQVGLLITMTTTSFHIHPGLFSKRKEGGLVMFLFRKTHLVLITTKWTGNMRHSIGNSHGLRPPWMWGSRTLGWRRYLNSVGHSLGIHAATCQNKTWPGLFQTTSNAQTISHPQGNRDCLVQSSKGNVLSRGGAHCGVLRIASRAGTQGQLLSAEINTLNKNTNAHKSSE